MTAPSDDKFTLAGGSAEFGSRAKNIFAGLESLEAQHVAVESSEAVQRESHALMKPDPMDEFFSSSSHPSSSPNFLVPARTATKRTNSSPRPGYEISPSKWKRYDLSDVSAGQLTEQSKQQAAKDFFNRFQVPAAAAAHVTHEDASTDHGTKHVFRKPGKRLKSKDDAMQPVDVKHCGMEDEDEDDDIRRTQVLSFAEDELLSDGSPAVEFRRRCAKHAPDRGVRSKIACIDDDDGGDDDGQDDTASNEHDTDIQNVADNGQRESDSDSGSDNFSELAHLGSDSDQEETEASRNTSDVEKYTPEDVDLDGID